MKKEYIIQLRPEQLGERYYMSRGKHVTNFIEKAKIFLSKEDAEKICEECTLWPERCVIIK
jgi:hypothetical protein